MSAEILAKLDELKGAMEAGQAKLEAGQDALRQDVADLRSEMRSELAAIRREANERQEIHLRILAAVEGRRASGLRQAG